MLYNASFSRGFGSIDKHALLLSSDVSGRVDDGEARNTLFRLNLRYYNQRSKKRLFVMSASGAAGSDLDLDNLQELGEAARVCAATRSATKPDHPERYFRSRNATSPTGTRFASCASA